MPPPRSRPRTSLDEFQFIDHLHRRFGTTNAHVIRGIGDDAAVVRPLEGHDVVLTTDLLAEGVHFDCRTATFEDIGYKAAVANLSDIAAMGATARFLLVSLAIPSSRTAAEIRQVYRGIMLACRPHGVELIGGDTSASIHGLFLNVVLTGSVPIGRALTRDGARAGDLLYVTGTIGDALAGLQLLSARQDTKGSLQPSITRADRRLIRRHLRPTPRLHIGQILSRRGLATSAIDLSDGLSGDLRHIAEQSHLGAELNADALPISSALRAYAEAANTDAIQLALQGGEDYELLFTVPPRHRRKIDELRRKVDCPLSCIGVMRPKGFGLRVQDHTGKMRRLPMLSYRHFEAEPHPYDEVSWCR